MLPTGRTRCVFQPSVSFTKCHPRVKNLIFSHKISHCENDRWPINRKSMLKKGGFFGFQRPCGHRQGKRICLWGTAGKVQKEKISEVNSICIMTRVKGETDLTLDESENHWSCCK